MVKRRISILIDEDTWEDFKKKCRGEGLTASTVLRLLIASYLEERIKFKAVT
jgi:antitoxin component of RelBE/YafQ-DinJ toxin-antitoxin module